MLNIAILILEISCLIFLLIFASLWISNPNGNYEPYLVWLGVVKLPERGLGSNYKKISANA
uniref:hypothetical protein n=1 Tax=Candidatus Electrothrix sp. TaxID=2170559 RepID=UPI0040559E3B